MKNKYIIILGILLFLSMFCGYLLFEISNDLQMTASKYRSDYEFCRRNYEELADSYQKLLTNEQQ